MAETFVMDRVDRISDILYGVATGGGLIGYRPIAKRVGARADFLSLMLERVSQRALEKGEPLWSALVVSSENRRPLSGFYDLARRVRPEYRELSDDQVWAAERERCYSAAG